MLMLIYRLHGPTQAGIHGHAVHGVYSVVLSGGYEDDVDEGDKFSYTGEGIDYLDACFEPNF
ncbi:hypothetical protein GYMLUDRAFT_72625 [Collybiopsis luxurians FD-317 M1]|uniref:YDG domain-containing protein n=1 Tax=Collybiopsis luxurians FD-317 M1 TaxID=944289 RepID=A0A0D0BF19_9AGAR|nr:hypothetical protein GYMLUDRAFT_72625 [Collybiopsis luxurians FD-317 M1]